MFVITQVKYVTINTAEFGELPLMNPISNMADNYYLLRPSPYLLALSTMPENRRFTPVFLVHSVHSSQMLS